jgi:Domain of unknown function (DUF1833)
MSRATLSARAVRSALALYSTDAWIVLISLTDPASGTTYRGALNTEDVTSRGNVFTAVYFSFTLPVDNDEAPKGMSVSIDNVDLRLVGLLRAITKPLQVMFEIVLAATPDTVEMTLTDLLLREVSWDESVIEGQLVADDPLNQAYPKDIYEPRTFPGMF